MKYSNELNCLFRKIKSSHNPEEIGVAIYENKTTGEFKRYVDGNPVIVLTALGAIAMEIIKNFGTDSDARDFMAHRYVSYLISWAQKICPDNTVLTKLSEVIEEEIPDIKDYLEG